MGYRYAYKNRLECQKIKNVRRQVYKSATSIIFCAKLKKKMYIIKATEETVVCVLIKTRNLQG